MTFITENIGYIILAICGLIVLSSTGPVKTTSDAELTDEAWFHSADNPCGPNYRGIESWSK